MVYQQELKTDSIILDFNKCEFFRYAQTDVSVCICGCILRNKGWSALGCKYFKQQ